MEKGFSSRQRRLNERQSSPVADATLYGPKQLTVG
jgi:hypothetical protein